MICSPWLAEHSSLECFCFSQKPIFAELGSGIGTRVTVRLPQRRVVGAALCAAAVVNNWVSAG
jgi:hypothetical protein